MAHRTRTQEEIDRSMKTARDLKAKQTLREQKKNIRNAQRALMAIGIIQLLFVAIMFYAGFTVVILVADIIIGAMFIGLYFLSREKPALAFNIGLIVYGIIQATLIVTNRDSLDGVLRLDLAMIIKLIIFATLFSGIAALKRIPKSLMDKKDNGVLDEMQHPLSDL